MASILYRCYSGALLLGLHIANFHLCSNFFRPTLLPLLFTTNEVRLVNSINTYLKEFNLDHQIPLDKIEKLKIMDKKGSGGVSNLHQSSKISNSSFDLLMSFSLQLIELFLIDILDVTDFQFRHFDWYVTLSVLIFCLTYLIPSCILYTWVFSSDRNIFNSRSQFIQNLINFAGVFMIWGLFILVLYFVTITKEISGNFSQISLYLLSLFGVSCLSILNGMGCIMGCYDSLDWYLGKNETNLQKKELELSYELRNLDALLARSKESKLNEIIWDQLIKIDSLARDVSLIKQSSSGIQLFIKFCFWTYCIYKTLYGIVRATKLVFFTLGVIHGINDHADGANPKSEEFYNGSGDFLSNIIAKIILVYFLNDRKTRSFLSFDDIVENNEEILGQITMIVNFLISLVFFSFSFQNVLLTFKNFKTLGRKLVGLSEFEAFHKLRSSLINLTQSQETLKFMNKNGSLFKFNIFNELTYLLVCEITGIYVVSTALLLNSANMPIHLSQLSINQNEWEVKKSSTVASDINAEFMNDWFDRWFAVGCVGTVLVIVILDQVQSIYFNASGINGSGLQKLSYDEEELM